MKIPATFSLGGVVSRSFCLAFGLGLEKSEIIFVTFRFAFRLTPLPGVSYAFRLHFEFLRDS